MRSLSTLLLAALLTVAASLPLAARILAHADYARSEPAADEVVAAPPKQVQVWFTQELFRRAGENWLRVTGPDGARVDLDDTVVDDNDRTLLVVNLANDLPDGTYRVAWRALSADDGHPKEGEFGFVVGSANAEPAEPAEPADATATPDTAPTAVALSTATPVAEATIAAPPVVETPVSSQSGGLPCLGSAPLAMLALGTVLVRRRRNPK